MEIEYVVVVVVVVSCPETEVNSDWNNYVLWLIWQEYMKWRHFKCFIVSNDILYKCHIIMRIWHINQCRTNSEWSEVMEGEEEEEGEEEGQWRWWWWIQGQKDMGLQTITANVDIIAAAESAEKQKPRKKKDKIICKQGCVCRY